MFDPLDLAIKIEKEVCDGISRKYYRLIRKDRWYGGICTSDCVGCNLRCVFCWSGKPRDCPGEIGEFYAPQQVFNALIKCAKKNNIQQLRISGNEPTIGKRHLLEVLALVETTSYKFILETNGTLIDTTYAKEMSQFKNLHVRVSIKGATAEEFSLLTGAHPEAFQLQLNALTNLLEAKVRFHPSIMLSFSTPESLRKFKESLNKIHPRLVKSLEKEYVFLYPHVVERLKRANIKSNVSYGPKEIPEELV